MGMVWRCEGKHAEIGFRTEGTNNDGMYTCNSTLENEIYDAKYWCVGAGFEMHPEVNYKESTRSF